MNNPAYWDGEKIILQYESLWRRDEPPQLREFLNSLNDRPTVETIGELCRVDVEHRFRRKLTFQLEQYLVEYPESFENEEAVQEFRSFAEELSSTTLLNPSTVADQHDQTAAGSDGSSLNIGFAAGAQVDQYMIVRPIGTGAFSRVYEATDTSLGRNVALKFLSLQPQTKNSLRQRMLREAHTVAVLDHPGINPVYGVGNWNGYDYIASRLVQGQTLDQQISQAPVSPRRAAEIARDIALSLGHAHQMGIVHRDIKPANIMMESDRPMLVDFGLAHFDEEQTQLTMAGDVIGTPAYMPPEQAQGRSFMADGRSDLYSLGVLLYRMLCGRLPFQGTTTDIISQVIHHDPVVPGRIVQGIERDLETIVMKCMEKDPALRYTTGELLAEDLQRYLDGVPILARRTGALGRMTKWVRRRPAAAGVLAIIGLTLAALGGALSQLQSVRRERDRAVTAEAEAIQARSETQSLLTQTAANAGQLAMQRGRWHAALEHFDQAIRERPEEDSSSIAWQRLSTLVSLRRIEQAQAALAKISDSNTPATDRASRLYWQAELELESDLTGGNCETLFEQAIEAGLDPADRLYAQGMLATHTVQAVEHFRSAILSDPFHHRARRELVLLLISLARLEEASVEAEIASQLFPEDPDFELLQSLVLALQGDLAKSNATLATAGLKPEETGKWESALRFVHDIPQTLQVFPDTDNFDSSQLNLAIRRLTDELIPLFASRGWIFPPRIARLFNDLPGRLIEYSRNETQSGQGDSLASLLSKLSEIHPEATLLLLRSYVEFSNLGILAGGFRNLSPAQIVGLENMRDNYRKCLDCRFLLNYEREDVWKGIYLSSMLLARFANHDVERNRREFIEAISNIGCDDDMPITHIRAYVITLIDAEAYGEASRWARHWVHVTDRRDLDAIWHQMIVSQRQKDWLKLERLGREALEVFPDNQDLAGFHQHAIEKIREVIDNFERQELKSDPDDGSF